MDSLLSPTQSVVGPVVFNVADGTYNEQIQLNQITGASAVNTITFQSASLDSTKVILTYSSSVSNTNWTFRLNGADYVILRKMTFAATGDYYGRIININGTAIYDTIENCRFIGYNTTSSYDDYALIGSWSNQTDNILIQNNVFSNGSFGVRITGYNSSTLSTGIQILNNHIIINLSFYRLTKLQLNAGAFSLPNQKSKKTCL